MKNDVAVDKSCSNCIRFSPMTHWGKPWCWENDEETFLQNYCEKWKVKYSVDTEKEKNMNS